MCLFVEQSALDHPVNLFGKDGFAGPGRSSDGHEEPPGLRVEPDLLQLSEKRTPVVDPFIRMNARTH